MDELRRRWDSGRSDVGLSSDAGDRDAPEPTIDGGPAADHPFSVDEERRYDEVAEIGRGGMGRVLLAVDRRLRRQVAVKHISAELRERPSAMRRFAREALITASLDHPAIVPIFDAGRHADGDFYYAMRFIRGRTLGEALRAVPTFTGRLALLRHFLVACEAVAFAHSRGVIHCDLKPDNILVGEFGETQVVDWGVARLLDDAAGGGAIPEASDEEPALDPRRVVGTPAYMSPEQAAGAPPDARSDVYSLGVVLYEVVAGRSMVDEVNARTLAAEARAPSPGPLALAPPETPPELTAIIRHAVAHDPAARYADARALAADVERFLDGVRVSVHRYSVLDALLLYVRRRRAAFAVAGVAAVLLLSLGVWTFVRTRAERDRAVGAERRALGALDDARRHLARALLGQAESAAARGAQPEAEVLAANALALAELPEARGVLAAYGFGGRPLLRERVELPACDVVRPRGDGAVLCLRDGAVSVWEGRPLRRRWERALGAADVSWAWEGRRVTAARSNAAFWVLDAADGRLVETLRDDASWFLPIEGGDEHHAIGATSSALLRIDLDAGAMRVLSMCSERQGSVVALDGGMRFLSTCRDGHVVIRDAGGREERRLVTGLSGGRGELASAALAPDGETLVVGTMTGEVQRLDPTSGAVLARRALGNGALLSLTFSPGGRYLAVIDERGAVTVLDPRTLVVLRRLPAGSRRGFAWAPATGSGAAQLLVAGRSLDRWELVPGQPAASFMAAAPPGLATADLSPRGDEVAACAGDGSVTVIDVRDGRRVHADRFQAGVVKGGRFDALGFFAWGASSPSVRAWDPAWRVTSTMDYGGLKRAARLPSGWLVLARYAHGPALVAPGARSPSKQEGSIDDPVYMDLDQTGDGARVVLIDNHDDLWEVRDGAPPVLTRRGPLPGARAVAISGDGRLLASAGRGFVDLLDAETLAPRRRIELDVHLDDIALSADGGLLAVGAVDHLGRVYTTSDGALRAVLRGHEARVAKVSFWRGPRPLLVTASWDGSARVWDLSVLGRDAESLRAEVEAAWGLSLEDAGGPAPR